MKRITFWGLLTVVCCIFALPIQGLASDGTQPFVVVSDLYGSSNFALSNGDGTLTEQQEIMRFDTGVDQSISSGVGDFDNDGVLDFILAVGNDAGIQYPFRKIENNGLVERSRSTESSRGGYPAGMAVADFDEDGKLDFVMAYDGSIDCDFYKGHGDMTFTPYEIPGAAPSASIAADSGDFDGDGHADFVVVSYSTGIAYINLGNGDGTFTTYAKTLVTWSAFRSVAAADLNGDGLDDLIVNFIGYPAYLAVFLNNGDVEIDSTDYGYGFDLFTYVIDFNMNVSPVDTYDLDNDGIQDLIIGGYNHQTPDTLFHGIGVMLGNGDGTFGPGKSYGGATEGLDLITSVSAPTLLPAKATNKDPIAAIYCETPEVTVGESVIVDGDDSEDPDGEIVSYVWDFGDGTMAEGLTAEHVYYDVGQYVITLTVTDNKGAEAIDEFMVDVSAMSAGLRVYPRYLKLRHRWGLMHGWVKLPQGCDATQVGVNSIEVVEDGSAQFIDLENSRRGMNIKTRRWLAKRGKFYLNFDRKATINALSGNSNQVVIRVNGEAFCNGDVVDFSAEDTIHVIKHKKKKKRKSWRGCKRRWRRAH